MPTDEIRRHAAFIKEDVLPSIVHGLAVAPDRGHARRRSQRLT
jgi:hypothetical protein